MNKVVNISLVCEEEGVRPRDALKSIGCPSASPFRDICLICSPRVFWSAQSFPAFSDFCYIMHVLFRKCSSIVDYFESSSANVSARHTLLASSARTSFDRLSALERAIRSNRWGSSCIAYPQVLNGLIIVKQIRFCIRCLSFCQPS